MDNLDDPVFNDYPTVKHDDPCPECQMADLKKQGGKDVCPLCYYQQPCCQP